MPIVEADPWRLQYFAEIDCPAQVVIPTDDPEAYRLFPAQRWIYNKLAVADSQGLDCGPHGVRPSSFPVFSKPLCNMRGMGAGSRVLENEAAYEACETPGHFWMTLLEGEHVSSDIAVVRGKARWFAHAHGICAGGGTFEHWTIECGSRPELETYCSRWIERHLPAYTGMLNLESIGGRIIEGHLRFTDQWPDLYGPGWLEALVRLYELGVWDFSAVRSRNGFSVVLFGPHGRDYRHPPAAILEASRATAGVSSVQITFHEDRPASAHTMPPGGFRLAIVNGSSLAAAREVRRRLARVLLA